MVKHWCIILFFFSPASGAFALAGSPVNTPSGQRGEHVRSLHFVLAPSPEKAAAVSYSDAIRLLNSASKNKYNHLVIQLAQAVQFDAIPTKRSGAWSKKQLVSFVEEAQKLNIEVIPEIKLLSHQEKLFQQSFPELMYNGVTYDADNEKVYQKVYALLDEIIELVHPKAIHIGHDEVAGMHRQSRKKWLKSDEKMLPADLFIKDVVRINDYLKSKGVETWMWGDMLLTSVEFPDLFKRPRDPAGYGKTLRDKLPKDIVICDWHYGYKMKIFKSAQVLIEEGFRVIGATWKRDETTKNFSQFAAKNGAYGMMATTWFHVPKGEWEIVDRIIEVSGIQFLNDFPDEK